MKTILILCIAAATIFSVTMAQDACKVLIPEISEEYQGACRRGFAHGKGNARGSDHYEGMFRKGLPHGIGTYTWANGDKYEGRWKEGMKHGPGKFIYKQDGEIIIQEGIWQNGKYQGLGKTAAYTIGHMMNVDRYRIRRTGDGNMILMSVHEHGRVHPSPRNLVMNINTGSGIQVGQSHGYENVSFPAEVRITYEMHDKLGVGSMVRVHFDVTINEPGVWEIRFYH